MTLRRKLLIIAAILVLLPAATGLAAAAAVYSLGTLRLAVHTDDTDFRLPLPATLVPLAIRFMPRSACADLREGMESADFVPQWEALRTFGDALRDLPDAVFVEVEGPDEHVQIAKRHGRLLVSVHSDDERIEISAPAKIVSMVTHEIERTCS